MSIELINELTEAENKHALLELELTEKYESVIKLLFDENKVECIDDISFSTAVTYTDRHAEPLYVYPDGIKIEDGNIYIQVGDTDVDWCDLPVEEMATITHDVIDYFDEEDD